MIRSSKLNPQRLTIILVFFIVFLGMCFRFERFAKRELWGDEIYMHNIGGSEKLYVWDKPLSFVVKTDLSIMQYPGDTLLLWPFHLLFGVNKWGLAIPHILMTFLGFYLLYQICCQYFKTAWGFGITFLIVAFNNNLISHAFELRPYGVLVTLSLASFLVMKRIIEKEAPAKAERVGIWLFIIITLLSHFYGSLILFFNYLFHLVVTGRANVKAVFLRNVKDYGLALVTAMPLWLSFTFGADKSYMHWDTFEYIPQGIVSVFKGVVGNLIGYKLFYIFLLGLFFPCFIPYQERKSQILFLFILIILPIVLIFLMSVKYHYWFIQRLFVWVMPLFAILIGWQWDSFINYIQQKKSTGEGEGKEAKCQ